MRRARAVAALAALALVAAGCGGDDSDEDAATTPQRESRTGEEPGLTKAEFIEAADAICLDARTAFDEIEERQREAAEADDFERFAEVLDDGAEEGTQLVERLRDLTPPASDEQVVDRYLTVLEEQVALLRRTADAAEREDVGAVTTLSDELQRAVGEIRGLAQGYGFQECGSDRGR